MSNVPPAIVKVPPHGISETKEKGGLPEYSKEEEAGVVVQSADGVDPQLQPTAEDFSTLRRVSAGMP